MDRLKKIKPVKAMKHCVFVLPDGTMCNAGLTVKQQKFCKPCMYQNFLNNQRLVYSLKGMCHQCGKPTNAPRAKFCKPCRSGSASYSRHIIYDKESISSS